MERGLHWEGRVSMLAASTPAIDEFSSHSDKLGPRWLYHRAKPSTTGARRAGAGKRITERQLEVNRARAREIFTEMAAHGQAAYAGIALPDAAERELGDVAVAAAICRSPVPRDGYYRRDIIGLPVIEEPYRLAAQIKSLARGAMALGYSPEEAVELARRCAMDTVPPVRVRVLWVLREEGTALTAAAAGKIAEVDRKVARRALEDLRALQVTACPAEDRSEEDDTSGPIRETVGYRDDGTPIREPVPKLWKFQESQDPDVADRVRIVRETVRKLSTSAGGVPNSGDKPSNPHFRGNPENPGGQPHSAAPSVSPHVWEHPLQSLNGQIGFDFGAIYLSADFGEEPGQP